MDPAEREELKTEAGSESGKDNPRVTVKRYLFPTETFTLDPGGEWQSPIRGLLPGDQVLVDVIGTTPFYLVVAPVSEISKHRSLGNKKLTRTWGWKPPLRPRTRFRPTDPEGVGWFRITSEEEHRLILIPTFSFSELEADVEIAVLPGRDPAVRQDDAFRRPRPQVGPGNPVEELGQTQLAILSGLGFLFFAILGIAVAIANVIALERTGLNQIGSLLAGDGTLALAAVTYSSLRGQSRRRLLDIERQRKSR